MYKVLVFGMTENPGGVESFLLTYYKKIDRNKIQFDFLCNSYELVAYEDELISLGARCFHITARSKNLKKYKSELLQLFKEHANEWNAIWVNVCSLANIDYLIMAKKFGIKKRIIHSHNSQNMDSKLRGLLHLFNKRRIGKIATDFWACSDDAAKWFYLKGEYESSVIIHNAIDVDRLRYNEEKRNEIREKYNWKDKTIIGNVGRLHFQKNQLFAIDIFKSLLYLDNNCELVFVGQGEDESILKNKVKELGIDDKVHFVGVQKDICAWLSSFDVFLFPSVFEGLGIAALEAQANGLSLLVSDKVIPKEVKINENFIFMNLESKCGEWALCLYELSKNQRMSYEKVKDNFLKNGYDIETEVEKLERLFEF